MHACVARCPRVHGALLRQATYADRYHEYVRGALVGKVARAADDKDKNRMWLVEGLTYCVLLYCCRWPARNNWRLVGRALNLVLRRWGHGFELASLKKAARDLLPSCTELAVVDDGVTCCCCGHAKPRMNGLVADAGQFFEAAEPAVAIQSVVDVTRAVQDQHGCCTVTVLRDITREGFPGRLSSGQPSQVQVKVLLLY